MYILQSQTELRETINAVKERNGRVVADIGCGNNPTNDSDILVDLYLGTDRPSGGGDNLVDNGKPVFNADIQDLSAFEDKSVDFIYSKHILEHVESPEKACSELVRVGKAGYIECPHPWDELTDILRGRPRKYHLWIVFVSEQKVKFTRREGFLFDYNDPIHAACHYMLSHKIEQHEQVGGDWEKVAIYKYFQALGDGRHTCLHWKDSFESCVV